jgi:hypothetical protein
MAYRDELDALRSREALLERDLADVRARRQELVVLGARAAVLEAELATLRATIARRTLPLLDRVHVAAPCSARWDDMRGDARERHCDACGERVYDLSAMTRPEAERFLAERVDACVRFHRRSDGTVLTADCPVGLRRRRVRRTVATLVALGGGGLALALAVPIEPPAHHARTPLEREAPSSLQARQPHGRPVMGRPATSAFVMGKPRPRPPFP